MGQGLVVQVREPKCASPESMVDWIEQNISRIFMLLCYANMGGRDRIILEAHVTNWPYIHNGGQETLFQTR